jgi:ABC-type Na+ transport system ATPase subunit NatA
VLDGIDLDVAEGTIFALLGADGAGKTTIVQILSTLIGAGGGEIRVAGNDPARDPDAVRAAIGRADRGAVSIGASGLSAERPTWPANRWPSRAQATDRGRGCV